MLTDCSLLCNWQENGYGVLQCLCLPRAVLVQSKVSTVQRERSASSGEQGVTAACCAAGPALLSAPRIRPRGAPGPSLGFAVPGPVNVACCSLGVARTEPDLHLMGRACTGACAAGTRRSTMALAPLAPRRSRAWPHTLWRGAHAQPLTTHWTDALPGACHMAVADSAMAVACDSGLLLLLDAACGAVLRRASSESAARSLVWNCLRLVGLLYAATNTQRLY